MKNFVSMVMVCGVVFLGSVGCGKSNDTTSDDKRAQAGAAAGGACKQDLIDGYNEIVREAHALPTQDLQQLTDALTALREHAKNFRNQHQGTVCTGTLQADNSQETIDVNAKMDGLIAEIDKALAQVQHNNPTPGPAAFVNMDFGFDTLSELQ